MTDIMDAAARSRLMSHIRGKNTKLELAVRRALHARGFRYRVHANRLPGTPDVVLPRYRSVIFVNGCFWHGHDCPLFRLPRTNPDFWGAKLSRNRVTDSESSAALQALGWRVLVLWECSLRGPGRRPLDSVMNQVAEWIVAGPTTLDVRGGSST